MARLLLISSGNSDIQVGFRDEDGQAGRCEIARDARRPLHEALLAGALPYEISATPDQWPHVSGFRAVFEDGTVAVTGKDTKIPLVNPVTLVPAKHIGIDRAITTRQRPDTVIVFSTHRTRRKEEAVANGMILASWLAKHFEIPFAPQASTIPPGHAGWVDYLIEDMEAEGPDGEDVNPAALQIIDDALRQIPPEDITLVFMSLDGGIPGYRAQIRSAAQYRFQGASFSQFRRGKKDGDIDARRAAFQPSDSFRTREKAKTLIRRGNFSGARELARYLDNVPQEQPWVERLDQASNWFEGVYTDPDKVLPGLSAAMDPDLPRCFFPMMRTEAELRAGRYISALTWTTAFADAAFIDGIARLGFVHSMQGLQGTLVTHQNANVPQSLLASRQDAGPALSKHRNRPGYRMMTGGAARQTWLALLDGEFVAAIEALEGLLRGDRGQPNLRHGRNALVHTGLGHGHIQQFHAAAVQRELWSAAGSGSSFLGSAPIRDLFSCLSDVDAEMIYDNIVEELCDVLDAHRFI